MADLKDPREIGVAGLSGLSSIANQEQEVPGFSVLSARKRRAETTVSTPAVQDVGYAGAGDSRFERGKYLSEEDYYNLPNYRGRAQTGAGQMANAITKGGILAGTTFLQGTVGLVNGIGAALFNWDASKFWDNEFNRTLKSVNDWSEEAFPNYYTDDERDNPFAARNIFSWNFLGDKLIKNLGFTVGAFYSGGVWTKPLSAIAAVKATGALPHIASGLGATLSAVNEGSIEAINNSTDWFNLQKAKLDDNYAKQFENLQFYKGTSNYDEMLDNLSNSYKSAIDDLEKRQAKVGNADLLMNLPILLASNVVEFGKLYARGFDTARKASGKIARDETGKYLRREATRIGKAGAGLKAATSEGLEEILQQAASNVAGEMQIPSRDYNLSMHAASINPEAEQESINYIKAFARGMNETFNDASTWEQGLIGFLTGALGMPTFGRANNNSPLTYIGKNKVLGLSGGAIGAMRGYANEIEEDNEIVDALNARIQSPEFLNYYRGLNRRQKFQDSMDFASEEGKQKEFKDAEYAQMVSDVALFAKAGKLDDYIALLDGAFDTSDENLDAIIRNTTKEDGTGPFIDSNGNKITSTPEGKEQMIAGLSARRDEMLKTIRDYRRSNEELVARFGNVLSDQQREELVWLDLLSKNQMDRAREIAKDSKPLIESLARSYQAEIDGLNLEESYYGEPLSEKEDKQRKNLQRKVDYLNKINSLDPDSIALNIARNSDMLASLIAEKAKTLTDDNVESVEAAITALADVPRLVVDSRRYADKLNEYLANPQKLAEDQEKETKKAEQDIRKNSEKKTAASLNDAKNFDDVRDVLSKTENTTRESVEKAINDSANPIVSAFKQLRDSVNSVRSQLPKDSSNVQAIEDANRLLDVYVSKANVPEIDTSSEIFLDTDNLSNIEGETPEQRQKRLTDAVKLINDSLDSSKQEEKKQEGPVTFYDPEEGVYVETGEIVGSWDVDEIYPSINNQKAQEQKPTEAQSGSIIVRQGENGGTAYSVDPNSFESRTDNSQSQKSDMRLADRDEAVVEATKDNPKTAWHPAVSQFDLAGMENGIHRENSNEEWKRVNAYITKGDGFNYVNDGRFAKNMANGGKLYFGYDSTFDGNRDTIFIYAKDGDSYIPVGSMFLGETTDENGNKYVGAAKNYIGMEDFNNAIKDEYSKLETKPEGIWISSKLGKVDKLYRGRVAWGDAHPVSTALVGSEITTPNIVIVTGSGNLAGTSDNTVAAPENASQKAGQAYIEVPNARRGYRGGKSAIAVNPVSINSTVLSINNPIINSINTAISGLAKAFKDGNQLTIGDNLRALSENLLIQNVEFSSNGKTLFINRIITENGHPVKETKNGKTFNKTENIRSVLLENDEGIIANAIKSALFESNKKRNSSGETIISGAHIRINKDNLSPEYTKQLIDGDLVQTFATVLKSEAAWFEFSEDKQEEKPQEQKPQELTPQEAKEKHEKDVSKKAAIFNMGRSGTAVKSAPGEVKSEKSIISESGRQNNVTITPYNRQILNARGYSDEWINAPDRTQAEIDNALRCG